jgi:hypothetical protein
MKASEGMIGDGGGWTRSCGAYALTLETRDSQSPTILMATNDTAQMQMSSDSHSRHISPELATRLWDSTRTRLETHLQFAIDTDDEDVGPALRTVEELDRVWQLVGRYDTEPLRVIGGRTRGTSADTLKQSIGSLGKAIDRQNKFWTGSMARRVLRAPYEMLRSSPEECQVKALTAVQQLQDHFEACIYTWRSGQWGERAQAQAIALGNAQSNDLPPADTSDTGPSGSTAGRDSPEAFPIRRRPDGSLQSGRAERREET